MEASASAGPGAPILQMGRLALDAVGNLDDLGVGELGCRTLLVLLAPVARSARAVLAWGVASALRKDRSC